MCKLKTSFQVEKETVRDMLQTMGKHLSVDLTTLSDNLNTSWMPFNNEITILDRKIERLNNELITVKTVTENNKLSLNKLSEAAIAIEKQLEGVTKNVAELRGDILDIETKLQSNSRVVDQLKSSRQA